MEVTNLNGTVSIPTQPTRTCFEIQGAAEDGLIDPNQCSLVQPFVKEPCGCMEIDEGNQTSVPMESPEPTPDPTTPVPATEAPTMDAASVPLSFPSTLCMMGISMTMIVHFAGY
jgi:hypothetical protein